MITTSAAELRGALPDGGALMGLDPGTKTIGVALCDAGWRLPPPARQSAAASLRRTRPNLPRWWPRAA